MYNYIIKALIIIIIANNLNKYLLIISICFNALFYQNKHKYTVLKS